MEFKAGDRVMVIAGYYRRWLVEGTFKAFGPGRAYIYGEQPWDKHGPYPLNTVRRYDEAIAQKTRSKLEDLERRMDALDLERKQIQAEFLEA